MSLKKTETRYLRAEHFLASVATSMPGWGTVAATADLELIAEHLADYLSCRLAAKDLDSVLAVLEDTLTREARFLPYRSKATANGARRTNHAEGGTRDEKLDPHFWG